jgi:hypothetical protein
VPQVTRRRADQLGDLVLHLEFAAVDLQQVFLAAVQHLGQRFHRAGLARAGGSQQQKHPGRPPFRRQARLIDLEVRHNGLQHGGLPDDAAGKQIRNGWRPGGAFLRHGRWRRRVSCASISSRPDYSRARSRAVPANGAARGVEGGHGRTKTT